MKGIVEVIYHIGIAMLRNINVKKESSNLQDLNLENITVNIPIVTY